MGAYTTFTQNDAGGTSRAIYVFGQTDASRVQVVREHSATAVTHGVWTLAVTGATVIPADTNRVGIWITNTGGARVFLRFDTTAPTSAVHHWYLDPWDRYEVPYWGTELAVSMLAASATGSLTYALATAA